MKFHTARMTTHGKTTPDQTTPGKTTAGAAAPVEAATSEATTTSEAATQAKLSDAARPLIIGHRGASKVAPENTLAAFERALQDGADGIEFDVRLARDGVPVVIHDATLKRTAHLDASITALSSSELAGIDVGSWFNRRFPAHAQNSFTRENVPTLSRVFETIAPRCRVLYVELKCEACELTDFAERVVSEVRAHRLERRVVIESFALAAIAEVKRIAPDLRTAAAFERRLGRPLLTPRALLGQARACLADELALSHSLVSPRMIEAARACGLPSVVWTVDHPSWIKRACALGLQAVITNTPAQMRAALSDFQEQRETTSQR